MNQALFGTTRARLNQSCPQSLVLRSLFRSPKPRMASSSTPTDGRWAPSGSSADPTVSHTVFTGPIIKSAQDDRSYRIIRLHNNLEAILVSDPSTDKAAASLNVGVGHLSDPDDRPGLAHFCEHLLFMVRWIYAATPLVALLTRRNRAPSNFRKRMNMAR